MHAGTRDLCADVSCTYMSDVMELTDAKLNEGFFIVNIITWYIIARVRLFSSWHEVSHQEQYHSFNFTSKHRQRHENKPDKPMLLKI